jgi:hypothetical protein
MKGGASLHDPRGLIHTKVQSYLARHPDAAFDEIERKCFKGKDMKHEFTAISPRLFESAMAGTCQILEREDYLGVLKAWRDYIPLEKDLSNINEVVKAMNDLDRCQEIAANAKMSLLDSKMFDYAQLVDTVCRGLLPKEGSQCEQWERFSDFLLFAQSARNMSVELHDAALHLISEVLIPRRPATVSTTQVEQIISDVNLSNWLNKLMEGSRDDALVLRCPWIWRPVPYSSG